MMSLIPKGCLLYQIKVLIDSIIFEDRHMQKQIHFFLQVKKTNHNPSTDVSVGGIFLHGLTNQHFKKPCKSYYNIGITCRYQFLRDRKEWVLFTCAVSLPSEDKILKELDD